MLIGPLAYLQIVCTVAVLLVPCACALSAEPGTPYAGPEVCAKCHKEIAASQSATAMAKTWDAATTLPLPPSLDEKKVEGSELPFIYQVSQSSGKLEFSLIEPDRNKLALPVEDVIGGKRHGVSFLLRVNQVGGIPLARPALVEARYAYSPDNSLVLSPGFQRGKPTSLERALGRPLSPAFQQKCLACHGQPGTSGAGSHGGVRCESCHGPNAAHARAEKDNSGQLIRPEKLDGSKAMAVCAQCHTGLSNLNQADPVPGELLVSSQVPALEHSECFRQTAGAVICTSCHNPHWDAPNIVEHAVKTCQQCHSAANAQHASICPVNASSRCVECHMPTVPVSGFKTADHWIAVHPEQKIVAANTQEALRSLVTPKREYLEMIAVDDHAAAEGALRRLTDGASFYDVAHATSTATTASAGGYIGDVQLSDMDPRLAASAAHLWYGETSGIIEQGSRYVILHRLPRDFKQQANELFLQAIRIRTLGDRQAAMVKAQEALKIFPYFLRAHIFMGTQIREKGDSGRAASVLAFATQSYPSDGLAQFQYALTLGERPGLQLEAFRRAMQLEPDMVAIYENLGAALVSSGDLRGATQVFRRGLDVNPLSAALNYYLGLVLAQQGDEAGAKQCLALAAKLDPDIVKRAAAAGTR